MAPALGSRLILLVLLHISCSHAALNCSPISLYAQRRMSTSHY